MKTSVLPPIPAKRYFTIGEVADLCAVKPHVLRYWEQEFTQLKPVKRRGNRRYYQHHEVLLVRRIRELLSIPERDRTDAEWDELNELEIRTAPGNRDYDRSQDRQSEKRPGPMGQGRRPDRNNKPQGNSQDMTVDTETVNSRLLMV